MKNLGKHYVWLSRRYDAVIRTVWEENGRLFIKFEHRRYEVKFEGGEYTAEI